jgi:hypothetical protein
MGPVWVVDALQNTRLSWLARAEAAEALIAAHPNLGPAIVSDWLVSNFGPLNEGSDLLVGIYVRPRRWRDGAAAIWWIVRAERNKKVTESMMAYAESWGGICRHRHHALFACFGMPATPLTPPGADPTFGNAYLTHAPLGDGLSPALDEHERFHSDQSALLGPYRFIRNYAAAWVIEGPCNRFERAAGLEGGGYFDPGKNC